MIPEETRRVGPARRDGSGDQAVVTISRDASLFTIADRRCAWCGAVLPAGKRQDSKFCDKKCRQASWRFKVVACSSSATDRSMIFAYADPPYPGKSKYYPERSEVDHASLVDRLTTDYPDGWVLSTSSGSLRDVLALCPAGVRVCAWFRGARPTKSRRALTSWEPVIVCGGRPLQIASSQDLRDALIYQGRFRAFPGAMIGMKPPAFCEWMFRQLGAVRGDRLDDLFPGSGAVTHAWERYVGQKASLGAQRPLGSVVRSAGDDGLTGDASLLPAKATCRVLPAPDDWSHPGGSDESVATSGDASPLEDGRL